MSLSVLIASPGELMSHGAGQPESAVAGSRIATVADVCQETPVVDAAESNRDVYRRFESDTGLFNLPVLDGQRIAGLINRESFMQAMAGHYRWEVFARKSCAKLMDPSPLIVPPATSMTDLATALLSLPGAAGLSTGFIVAENGHYVATGRTADVMAALVELERRAADSLRRRGEELVRLVDERTRDLADVRRAEEKQRVEHELARDIIDRMMRRPGLNDERIQFRILPAERASGDIIAASLSPRGELVAMLADATGHGLSPAITLVPILTLFYRLVEQGRPLAYVVMELNRELRATMPVGRYVAAALVSLDRDARSALAWVGGMPAVLLVNKSGNVVERCASDHLPLGIVDLQPGDIGIVRLRLSPGDQILLHSDGLVEAENENGEPFGQYRLEVFLRQWDFSGRLASVEHGLRRHVGARAPHDDVSLMLVECRQLVPGRGAVPDPSPSVQAGCGARPCLL